MREFVADVRGEGYSGYPTFHDGWVANTIIDIVRNGQGWTAVPEWSNERGTSLRNVPDEPFGLS